MGARESLAAGSLSAAEGPQWLVSRLGAKSKPFFDALFSGAKLTPEQRLMAERALAELTDSAGEQNEAVVLERLAVHFLARNEIGSGVQAALAASRFWNAQLRADQAILVLDHAIAMTGPANPANQNFRFQLVRAKASVLATDRQLTAAAGLLRAELSNSNARYSLENQVSLLVQQATAAHGDGDGIAARQMLAEAMSLTNDADLHRKIQTAALGIAMLNANGEDMTRLSAAIADLPAESNPPAVTNYDMRFAEVLTLLIDGEADQADAKAERLYLEARRAHDHDVAVRAVYARVVIEQTIAGPSDRTLALAEQAVWLASERGSNSMPLLPVVSLCNLYLDRAEPLLASAALEGVEGRSLSSVDQLDLAHTQTRTALVLQRVDGLVEQLREREEAAEGLQAAQYTGVHYVLLAEACRLGNEIDGAVEASNRALHWLGDCPNQTWVREAVAESIRCKRLADDSTSSEQWIKKIKSDTAAGAAFIELCEGLMKSDPIKLRSAAAALSGLKYRYESMRARLEACQIEGDADLDLAQQAREAGIDWIAEAVESIGQTQTEVAPNRGLPISARQSQVLDLMALGYSNKGIAAELFISDRTASTHVSAILGRLDCRNRAEAVAVWTAARTGTG